jgi:hypothetical protein
MNKNKLICPRCLQEHEWHNFFIEKNSKLLKVKKAEIAWCNKHNNFVTREKIDENIFELISILKN